MKYSEMVSVVEKRLRQRTNNEDFTAKEFCDSCVRTAAEQQVTPRPKPESRLVPGHGQQATQELCVEVLNDFIRRGILIFAFISPGRDHHLPCALRVSKYGLEVLTHGAPAPYDPDGYLAYLTEDRELHPVVLEYVAEAMQAFRQGCFRSTIVMVGGASERLALLLEAALVACSDPEVSAAREKHGKKLSGSSDLPSATRIKLIGTTLDALKESGALKTHPDLKEAAANLSTLLGAIRRARNEHGHPKEVCAARQTALMALQVFPEVCRHTYQLMEWLSQP